MASIISKNFSVPTAVTICSNALYLLAAEPISSFDDDTTEAQITKALYPTTYATFLTESNWNFATKQTTLSKLVEKPSDSRYTYAYALPSDMLSINFVSPNTDYRVHGNKIFSNSSKLDINYIYLCDESALSPSAVTALEYLIASKIAFPLTNDSQKTQIYNGMYIDALMRARYVDSQNDPNDAFDDNPLISVRY